MSASSIDFDKRRLTMSGPLGEDEMQFLRARVTEGLGEVTEIIVEFTSDKFTTKTEDILGEYISLAIETDVEGSKRHFGGHCVEVECCGIWQGVLLFRAVLRCWPWFLDQTADCRIFQEKTAMEIIKQVFGDNGFSDFQDKTTGTFATRTYCVQYRETDFAFVSRLMEEEGIYYYFDYTEAAAKLVMLDSSGSHTSIEGSSSVDFYLQDGEYHRRDDHVYAATEMSRVTTGKVTLNDYFYETSQTDLKSVSSIPKGQHSHKSYERYDYGGRFSETGRGETLARHRMEGFAARYRRHRLIGNLRRLATGHRFKLTGHPMKALNAEYVVTRAVHELRVEILDKDGSIKDETPSPFGEELVLDIDGTRDRYRCKFEVMPASEEYKSPQTTPRPVIAGLQTAVVVGPSGEEIYTDEFGRVKVHFYWDREGQKDDKSSCWIRKAEPWTGKGWGMVWLPRIGQEVVVEFEEGDPDRPLIVGMLFNDQTKHPFALPGNMTRMGWTSVSSKGGTAGGYDKTSAMAHEFIFEDKKDSEFVRLQSERDYFERIKNNATITVGLEHKDKGDYSMTIHNDRTETVKEGNHTFTVEKGKENYTVEDDRTVKMNKNHTEEVAKDQKSTIGSNQTVDIGKNQTVDIGSNQAIDVGQNITIEAGTKITLKCGQSSIVMDMNSITLKSMDITCTAQMNFAASGSMAAEMTSDMTATVSGSLSAELSSDLATSVGGTMVDVGGDAMLTLKGGITMIN
ncbi:MAG: type VI secretion system tip protein TssI/VgrG [Pseudomonadota bacterium]